ncbi:MAG: iron-sulfur cluster insertion protein ErpA [Bdellovibrionales bacterium]|nr:iron-sulfur cluster insertion protein ErpA [Bdellovibrionales bacterium]
MIALTETAARKISQLRQEEGASTKAVLRVSVRKGGCSGFSYDLKFDEQAKPGDKVFENFSEKVIVDSESLLYLVGMTLDYEGGLNGQGFVFANPNATKTCGCGSSFGV